LIRRLPLPWCTVRSGRRRPRGARAGSAASGSSWSEAREGVWVLLEPPGDRGGGIAWGAGVILLPSLAILALIASFIGSKIAGLAHKSQG
jgi:hypothetical protein